MEVKEYKEPQHNLAAEKFLNPKKLYLPLAQHTGSSSTPCVKAGDSVEEAQLIAQSSAYICANLHAPAKGKIINIDNWYHPNLKKTTSIIIECEEGDKNYPARPNITILGKQDIIDIIKTSGIIGMGGAAFPTHIKLSPPKKIEVLIVNGCECEPYLACDYRLMTEHMEEIFMGLAIICRIIAPDKVIFAIEDNKHEIVKKINLLTRTKKYKLPPFELAVLETDYPQGSEKQLIYSTLKLKVPGGKIPPDVGCLVHNVATIFAVYQAVYFNKPLIERLVTFAGDALIAPKNIWVKVGTRLGELFEREILQFKYDPKKIICGGPMMGVSLPNLDYPILKGTGGFLFLNKDLGRDAPEETCIKCSRCVDACPMNLLPLEYAKRVKAGEFNNLTEYNIKDCLECGSCAYTCPAKIPLVHYAKIGKQYLPV